MPQNDIQAGSTQSWRELTTPRTPPGRSRRRRIMILVSMVLLAALIFAALRFSMVATTNDDQLQISIGNQQSANLDLRQSTPISADLFGANVFPAAGSSSVDAVSSGFAPYTPIITQGLQDMGIKLLRYPGGDWGEQHVLSYGQLDQFSQLLNQTHSDGLIQASLTGLPADLAHAVTPAQLAGKWVNYMNLNSSYLRTNKNSPFHPVVLWTIGNEPDLLNNAATGKTYTVADYTNSFIEFSKEMHNNYNGVKVFGPEISHFYGVGAGPYDINHQAWMETFLQGVGNYEKAHHVTLLDGVSFHSYPFITGQLDPSTLFSNSDSWNYLLSPLRSLVKREIGRDLPIAVTEISTNPSKLLSPTRGDAAIWWADTLGTLMNQQVEYAAYFSAAGIDSPYPLFSKDGLTETPMARVMQLYSHMQHNLVPLGIQRDPISVYATEDDAHQAVSLMIVNKSPSQQLVQIRPTSSFFGVSAWHNLDVTIQGYEMMVVTLHRSGVGAGGGAEVYSYLAPPNDNKPAVPLTFTQCGNKTDALANTIPC